MFSAMSLSPLVPHGRRHSVMAEQSLQVAIRQAELLAEALQIDQGRAQIMRDAVDEHLVLLLLLVETGRHIVKCPVDLGNLVAALQRRREPLALGETAGVVPEDRQPFDHAI